MSIFSIHHITKFTYNRAVVESINEIRLYPYECREQETLQHEITLTEHPVIYTYTDYWGNKTGNFNILDPLYEFVIDSRLTLRTIAPPSFKSITTADKIKMYICKDLYLYSLANFSAHDVCTEIATLVKQNFDISATIYKLAESICAYIFQEFNYIKGITTIETTVAEILSLRSGVCQDFAHLMLELLRYMHIPCRYVSGYICPNKSGMRGEGATHAWVEVWIPEAGWRGIDPTNNTWVTDTHIKLAVGRNFSDCTPVKGIFKGPAIQQLSVYVSVGYEDGTIFEDNNAVNMEVLSGGKTQQLPVDYMQSQQIVQQQ